MVNKKICSSTYFGHNYNSNIINALRTASTSNQPTPWDIRAGGASGHIINALRTVSTANRSHSPSSRPRERS
uniref:hypothetical protein n=1 Tax=Candidatus Limisoma sp. TaxID=3076476 RepID=UPI0040269D82